MAVKMKFVYSNASVTLHFNDTYMNALFLRDAKRAMHAYRAFFFIDHWLPTF
jgi:hypothetical protein